MSLIEQHTHIHVHVEGLASQGDIDNLKTMIMANFAELKTEFDALKTAIAEERAQAQDKLTELQNSIDELNQNITNGGTEEERTQLLADITAQVAEVKSIIPDTETPAQA